MKQLLLVFVALFALAACERHSWDETRKLHLHESHEAQPDAVHEDEPKHEE